MKRDILIPILIGLVMIAIFLEVSNTLSSVLIFIPGVLVAYLFYLRTFYKKTPQPDRILPLYLLALGIQFLHFAEEYLTDFTIEIPKLLGQPEYPLDYWVVFNMGAYFVFLLGGIIIYQKKREFMIIPLFFIFVGVLFNSIAHVALALYVGGYFTGLYSALLYIIIGPILLKRVLEETHTDTGIS